MEDSKLREINDIVSSPDNRSKNPVSLLMEAGSQLGETVTFNYVDELAMGLSNVKLFICEVKVGRLIKCKGSGNSKKQAKSNAADQALELIRTKTGGSTTSPGTSKGSPSHTPSKNTSGPTFSLSPAIRGIQDSPSTSINPIGSLQEMCMKNNWTPPIYDVIHEVGEAHMKTFIYECKIEAWVTQGKGRSKKSAKKLAAENMLSMISEAAKSSSPAGVHTNPSSGSPFSKYSDKQPSGPSPSRSNPSTSPISFLSSYLYDEMEFEEPRLNQVSQGGLPSVADAEMTDEFCSTLEDKGEGSGFTITYHDLPEKGYSGNYMCFVRLTTKPPTVCSGMGYTKACAHEKAAKNALHYLNTVCSN